MHLNIILLLGFRLEYKLVFFVYHFLKIKSGYKAAETGAELKTFLHKKEAYNWAVKTVKQQITKLLTTQTMVTKLQKIALILYLQTKRK
ncbi:MAG: hypothetical protein U5M50_09360 [Sphingobium sp.]|nr:hypothetical protein [Sphingobium sp.]